MKKSFYVAFAGICAMMSSVVGAQSPEPPGPGRALTAEDILSIRYAAHPAVSPDGGRVAFLMVEPPDIGG